MIFSYNQLRRLIGYFLKYLEKAAHSLYCRLGENPEVATPDAKAAPTFQARRSLKIELMK